LSGPPSVMLKSIWMIALIVGTCLQCGLNHTRIVREHDHSERTQKVWQGSKIPVRLKGDLEKGKNKIENAKLKSVTQDDAAFTVDALLTARRSELLEHHFHSPIKLFSQSNSTVVDLEWSKGLSVLTLGLFPMMERVKRETDFTLIDSAKKIPIKKYRFTYENTTYYSWLSIPTALFTATWSPSFSYTADAQARDMKASDQYREFESDLMADLQNGKIIVDTKSTPAQNVRLLALPVILTEQFAAKRPAADAGHHALVKQLRDYNFEVPENATALQIVSSVNGTGGDFKKNLFEFVRKTEIDYIIAIEIRSLQYDPAGAKHNLVAQYEIVHVKTGNTVTGEPVVLSGNTEIQVFTSVGESIALRTLSAIEKHRE
jgi:hypothetical protein